MNQALINKIPLSKYLNKIPKSSKVVQLPKLSKSLMLMESLTALFRVISTMDIRYR